MSPQRFTGRSRKALERARAVGYLNAACPSAEILKYQYTFWCWRLRLPAVWCERKSPRSKFGRVVLDLFTTPHVLSEQGVAELTQLAEKLGIPARASISSGDGVWERVPSPRLEELTRAIFRAATRNGSYEQRRRNAPPEIVTMFEAIRQRALVRKSA